MALNPDKIGTEKSFNSFNTGQLEDTYGLAKSRQIGAAPLSHKLFMEDLFIRKFLKVIYFLQTCYKYIYIFNYSIHFVKLSIF